jgi:nitrite reductase/ring-hydroxylating ferredoxin subunit
MREIVLGPVSSFTDPGRKVVDIDGVEVGVFHLKGRFTAYENLCPHQGGPVCQGKIVPRVEEIVGADRRSNGMSFSKTQTNIVCPWHGYEFDIATGCHQGDQRLRLRMIDVHVADGDVVLRMPESTERRSA